MALPIFYINEQVTDFITLPEETSKHVVQVLRMKTGEELQLTDGQGSLLNATIADDHKKKCTVRVISKHYKERKTKQVSIAISLLKNAHRFEWFLEKATEIGVSEIVPLLCARTEKQHFRFERMNNILVSAMLQSQQVWLPILRPPSSYDTIVFKNNYTTKLIAHCEDEQKSSLKNFAKETPIQILIGPEGDFTTDEIHAAINAGYTPVTLGETRLRTETAGMVAAALLCI